MTNMHNSLDFGRTTRKAGFRLAAFWQGLVSLVVRYRNRREIIDLASLPDQMLHDIGVTRDDVTYATRGGMFDDHSAELGRIAMLRRSHTHIV